VQPADDDRVHYNTNLLGPNGRGHVLGQQGRLPLVLGARRVIPAEDYYLGKPKFLIPHFDGKGDVEDYLTFRSSRSRHSGICMFTLKIKRSDLHPQNLMAMHCVDGIIF
jgi:hypothetical protein